MPTWTKEQLLAHLNKKPKVKAKYNATPTQVDGFRFASKKEAKRYGELKAMGVHYLSIHPKYHLDVNGVHICDYVADFEYVTAGGDTIVEDVKGFKTPAYQLKKRLMKAIWKVDVVEI